MKLEIDETKVNSMNKGELIEHLAIARNSMKQLEGHVREVARRIFNLTVAELETTYSGIKTGQKIKVVYRPTYLIGRERDAECVGFFVEFGAEPRYTYDKNRVFLVMKQVRSDGSEGKRYTTIPADFVKSIEPCE